MANKKKTRRRNSPTGCSDTEAELIMQMEQLLESTRAKYEAVKSLEWKMDRWFDDLDRRDGLRFKKVMAAFRLD